jgi:hypothetical protein
MIDPDDKAPAAADEDQASSEERGPEEQKAKEEREDPFALDPLGPPGGRPW